VNEEPPKFEFCKGSDATFTPAVIIESPGRLKKELISLDVFFAKHFAPLADHEGEELLTRMNKLLNKMQDSMLMEKTARTRAAQNLLLKLSARHNDGMILNQNKESMTNMAATLISKLYTGPLELRMSPFNNTGWDPQSDREAILSNLTLTLNVAAQSPLFTSTAELVAKVNNEVSRRTSMDPAVLLNAKKEQFLPLTGKSLRKVHIMGVLTHIEVKMIGTWRLQQLDCIKHDPEKLAVMAQANGTNTLMLIAAVLDINQGRVVHHGYTITKERQGWVVRDPGEMSPISLSSQLEVRRLSAFWL
jgi:hypothetical protein